MRDLSVAYLLVGLTYLYVGVLIFAAFPSPPLSKDCIEPVRFSIDSLLFAQLLYFFFFSFLHFKRPLFRPLTFIDNMAQSFASMKTTLLLYYLLLKEKEREKKDLGIIYKKKKKSVLTNNLKLN